MDSEGSKTHKNINSISLSMLHQACEFDYYCLKWFPHDRFLWRNPVGYKVPEGKPAVLHLRKPFLSLDPKQGYPIMISLYRSQQTQKTKRRFNTMCDLKCVIATHPEKSNSTKKKEISHHVHFTCPKIQTPQNILLTREKRPVKRTSIETGDNLITRRNSEGKRISPSNC